MLSYIQWKKTYELTIENPSDTEGFQGTFILYYIRGMNKDFSDVRFSTVKKKPIPYVIENVSIFNSCRVWLSLPAGETKILMYIGNGAATSDSSPADVFDYYIKFEKTDNSAWTLESGSLKIDNGVLLLNNSSKSTILTSKTSYPVNTFVEIRAHHTSGNDFKVGFATTSPAKAAAWAGSSDYNKNDLMLTINAGITDYTNDGVDRSGNTFYTYGVLHLTAGDKFYINYVLRGTATTALPGNVSLPIQLFSENAESLYVDWVRIRKYSATEPTITVGRRYLQQTVAYIFNESYYSHTDTIAVFLSRSLHKHFYDVLPVGVKLETFLGEPEEFTSSETVSVSLTTNPIIRYEELGDYSLDTCDISRSTSEVYTQLSADLFNEIVPPEGTTITHIVRDSKYIQHMLFSGQVITKNPKLSHLENAVSIEAADLSRNLSIQPVPWNYQVISLDSTHVNFSQWIIEILDSAHTGVIQGNIIDTNKPDKQFVFKPDTTRMEAIQEIADYMGCIAYIKLLEKYDISTDRILVYSALYVVPVKDIDQRYGGFDLPTPLELTWPDNTIVDKPSVPGSQDTQYNSVMVHGVLSNTQATVVAVACTPEVAAGTAWANTYTLEDNGIYEKSSTAEAEAIKWLLYFNTQKSSVQLKFVDRYDIELYQRIRFGTGFSKLLQDLTDRSQLPYVVAYDPRDEANSKHNVDVSGVPSPSWLRVSEVKYHSGNVDNYCDVKLVTDYIYSSVDPVVQAPYNQYLAPGYYKPPSDEYIPSTQSIVESTISKKQADYVTGTLLSADPDTKIGTIKTNSGKILKVSLPWL